MGKVHGCGLHLFHRLDGEQRGLHPLQVRDVPREGRNSRPFHRPLRPPSVHTPHGGRPDAQRAHIREPRNDFARLERRTAQPARLPHRIHKGTAQRGARRRNHNEDRMAGRLQFRGPDVRLRHVPGGGSPDRRQHQPRNLPRQLRLRALGQLRP